MGRKRAIIAVLLVAVLGAGGVAWYRLATPRGPAVPDVPLEGVEKPAADAVREAQAAVRADPKSGSAWGRLGMVLHANGFTEHVPLCYSEAARLDPNDRAWPYLHGLFLGERQPTEAVPLLERSLTLSRNTDEQAAAHFRLVLILTEEGRLEPAAGHLEALARLEPPDGRVRFAQAVLALARGDREQARPRLAELTDNPFCRKRSSQMLATLSEPAESRKLQARAAALPDDEPWPDPLEARMQAFKVDRTSRLHPYQALLAEGRSADALAYLRKLAAESPDREVCFILGVELAKRNEFEEAEGMLRAALRYEPTNIKARLALTECLLGRGEQALGKRGREAEARDLFQRAVVAADEALAHQPELGDAHLARGRALKHLDRPADAIAAFRKAVLIQPNSADAHLELGEALAAAGRPTEGLEHLETAVQFARPGYQRPADALKRWRAKAPKGGG